MTTPLQGSEAFYQVMILIRDALMAAVQAGDLVSFNRVSLVPGAIAWDDCDQCGLLAVAQTRLYLSDNFPSEAPVANSSQAQLLACDLAVQAIRCAPVPNEAGDPPSVDELQRSARTVSNDQVTILCTVIATLDDLTGTNRIIDYNIRQSLVLGPEGACVGSELAFSVAVVR